MKISPINYNYCYSQNVRFKKQTQVKNEQNNNVLPFYYPYFTSNQPTRSFGLRMIDGLPCAFCNERTITFKEIKNFHKKIVNLTGESLILQLNSKRQYYKEVENEVADTIIKYAKKYPDLTLDDLLFFLKEEEETKLLQKQKNNTDELEKFLKEKTKNGEYIALKEEIEKHKKFVTDEDGVLQYEKFYRDELLEQLRERFGAFQTIDSEIYNGLWTIISRYPKANNNSSAFILKYSKDGSSALIERLLNRKIGTIEHIIPKFRDGQSIRQNYLLLCRDCNSMRKDDGYDVYLETHPEIKENIKKYLYSVEDLIDRGILKGYDDYVEDVIRTIYIESKGKIDLMNEIE